MNGTKGRPVRRKRMLADTSVRPAAAVILLVGFCLLNRSLARAQSITALTAANESGIATSVSKTGVIDRRNPFFLSLGTNGRACVDCHQADQGWSISPA